MISGSQDQLSWRNYILAKPLNSVSSINGPVPTDAISSVDQLFWNTI